jgi:hypothetical protein
MSISPRPTSDSSIGRCQIAAFVGAMMRRPIKRAARRLSSPEVIG